MALTDSMSRLFCRVVADQSFHSLSDLPSFSEECLDSLKPALSHPLPRSRLQVYAHTEFSPSPGKCRKRGGHTPTNANKRAQTQTSGSLKGAQNADKRAQTRANADKREQTQNQRFTPPFAAAQPKPWSTLQKIV